MRNGSTPLLLAALLFGCTNGGFSASTNGNHLQNLNAGLVRSDAPTTMTVPVLKPFYPEARVELLAAPTGPFAPAAGMLPVVVAGGEDLSLWITFTPPPGPAAAVQQGTIELLFSRTTGGEAVPVTLHLEASIETPSARLLQNQVQLGDTAVGETVKFGIYFENTSTATPVMVTDITLPAGDFSIAPDAFPVPCPVAPGSRFYVRMLYAPQDEGSDSSLLSIHHSAAQVPLEATLAGAGIPPLVVLDYPAVPLDAGTFESDWITFDVSAEGVGILLEAWGDPLASVLDLVEFEGPGVVYEAQGFAGPLDWLDNYPAGGLGYLNVALPDSNLPAVQLAPGGGTYRFRVRDAAAATSTLQVRATVSQRRAGTVDEGTLDLRVFLADGITIADPNDPMSDNKLGTALRTVDAILGAGGIRVGTVSFTVMEPAWNIIASAQQAEDLVALKTAGLPEGALNLFFVSDITYGGVTGVSGAEPGPRDNGTPYSGVVIDYGAAQARPLGVTTGHGIAHYLGADADLLLPEAAYAGLRHPLLSPGLPEDLLSPPESTNYASIQSTIDGMPPAGIWCGACNRTPAR